MNAKALCKLIQEDIARSDIAIQKTESWLYNYIVNSMFYWQSKEGNNLHGKGACFCDLKTQKEILKE